jgi:hypothetical protein
MVDEYTAGPGSVYGVGKTFIRRYVYTTPQDDVSLKLINKYPRQARGVVSYSNALGVSKDYFTPLQIDAINNISNNGNTVAPPPPPVKYTTNNAIAKYTQLKTQLEKQQQSGSIFGFNPFKNTLIDCGSGSEVLGMTFEGS